MRVNHPRSSNPPYANLSAHAARTIDRLTISGGERISSTERQLIEACVRAITGRPLSDHPNSTPVEKQTQRRAMTPNSPPLNPIDRAQVLSLDVPSSVAMELTASVG